MKQYTESDVRSELARMAGNLTYRALADASGIDVGDLHRMVHGKRRLTTKAAVTAGFIKLPDAYAKVKISQ